MDLLKTKYIIVEIIPTALTPQKGDIVQLSAIKLDGIQLLDRFDYRLNEDKIYIPDFIEMCNYDKESFTYKETSKEIMEDFRKWVEDLPILILDNAYTLNFLEELENNKESVLKYLNKEYHDQIIEELIQENNIEPTNYIVDILYESLIKTL